MTISISLPICMYVYVAVHIVYIRSYVCGVCMFVCARLVSVGYQ